jgi:hypothetical protein
MRHRALRGAFYLLILALATVMAPRAAFAASSISYPDFSDGSGLQLNGSATLAIDQGNAVLRLTDDGTDLAGSAFTTSTVSAKAFRVTFAYRTHDGAADGFAFAIQGSGPTALGDTGGGLGAKGIPNIVAVMFSEFQRQQCIATSNATYGFSSCGDFGRYGVTYERYIADEQVHFVWVDYDGVRLEVRHSDTPSRPNLPILKYNLDIPAAVGGNNAYIGFTGATGGYGRFHEIYSFDYQAVAVGATAPIDFGNVARLSSSEPMNMVLDVYTDTTFDSPTFGGADATDFSIVSNTCTGFQAAGSQCTIALRFKPTKPFGTSESAVLTVTDSTGSHDTLLSGRSTGQVAVTKSQKFGSLYVGDTIFRTITFRNNQSVPISGMASSVDGGAFAITSSTCSGTLGAFQTCSATLGFTPTSEGSTTATLTISNTGPDRGSPHYVTLTGTGVAEPYSLSRQNILFGTILVGETGFRGATIRNNRSVPIQIEPSIQGGSSSPFSTGMWGDDCEDSVPAQASCGIWVNLFSEIASSWTDTLVVSSPANGTQVFVPLNGRTVPLLQLLPNLAGLAFGQIPVGSTSTEKTLTIKNNSPGNYALQFNVGSPFQISSTSCEYDGEAGIYILRQERQCSIVLVFSPTSRGKASGSFTLNATPRGFFPGGSAENFSRSLSGYGK